MIDIAILDYKNAKVDIIRDVDLGDNPQVEDVDFYLHDKHKYHMSEIYFMFAQSETITINEINE